MTENAKRQKTIAYCAENQRLMEEFGQVVQELILLHEQQFISILDGDLDSHRFDLLIHMTTEKKRQAKYAYMKHSEEHGC